MHANRIMPGVEFRPSPAFPLQAPRRAAPAGRRLEFDRPAGSASPNRPGEMVDAFPACARKLATDCHWRMSADPPRMSGSRSAYCEKKIEAGASGRGPQGRSLAIRGFPVAGAGLGSSLPNLAVRQRFLEFRPRLACDITVVKRQLLKSLELH